MASTAQFAWLADYLALTQACGLADLLSRSRVQLTGADRVQFLHSFCTNDIKRLAVGQGCEAFLTSHQGKTVGHVYVRVMTDSLELDAAPGQATKIIQHLDRFVISDRVEFHDLSTETGELLLTGKEATAVLERVARAAPPGQLWDHNRVLVSGVEVLAQRVDYAGGNSFFLTMKKDDLSAAQQALLAAGATLCKPEAVEAARIEAGVPLFGSDITEENLPQEIGRDKSAISFTKGCYLGQETVARIDAMGHVNRLLTGVKFSSSEIPAPGTELLAADKQVGLVTSASWSPRLGAPLALAIVRRTHTKPGTTLSSALGPAEVVSLPIR